MKYSRFEELPVWQSAVELAVRVYELTRRRAFRGPGDLVSQLRRAALSVSNNIAEGFERGTTAELLNFLYIARGSAGEVRSMLHFVERMSGRRAGMAELRREMGAVAKLWQGTAAAGEPRAMAAPERNEGPAGAEQSAMGRAEISNLRYEISDLRSERESVDGGGAKGRSGISDLKSEISERNAGTEKAAQMQTAPAIRSESALAPGAEVGSEVRSEIDALLRLAESCSRQIRGWADNLQNSDIAGPKHLTTATRQAYENRKRADAFWRKVDAVMEERAHRMAQPPNNGEVSPIPGEAGREDRRPTEKPAL